jgi:hypothetical protein
MEGAPSLALRAPRSSVAGYLVGDLGPSQATRRIQRYTTCCAPRGGQFSGGWPIPARSRNAPRHVLVIEICPISGPHYTCDPRGAARAVISRSGPGPASGDDRAHEQACAALFRYGVHFRLVPNAMPEERSTREVGADLRRRSGEPSMISISNSFTIGLWLRKLAGDFSDLVKRFHYAPSSPRTNH